MATPVIMPRQGQSVESCVIGVWHKKKGDKVSIGDLLFTYETDKATFEEEAKVEGTFLDRFFEEGDDVECLKNVCVIGNEGESVEEFRPDTSGGGSGSVSETSQTQETVLTTTAAIPASRATEVCNEYDAKKESVWLGHSEKTAMRYYLMVTDEDYAVAAGKQTKE